MLMFSKNGQIGHALLHRCLTGDFSCWDGEGIQGREYIAITKTAYCITSVFFPIIIIYIYIIIYIIIVLSRLASVR